MDRGRVQNARVRIDAGSGPGGLAGAQHQRPLLALGGGIIERWWREEITHPVRTDDLQGLGTQFRSEVDEVLFAQVLTIVGRRLRRIRLCGWIPFAWYITFRRWTLGHRP